MIQNVGVRIDDDIYIYIYIYIYYIFIQCIYYIYDCFMACVTKSSCCLVRFRLIARWALNNQKKKKMVYGEFGEGPIWSPFHFFNKDGSGWITKYLKTP